LGINYVDSSWHYINATCDKVVGHAIAGRDRDAIVVSTKNTVNTDVKSWRQRLDVQLKDLATDYIDYYHMHSLHWDVFREKAVPEGHLREAQRARDEGLIRHLSFSSHDRVENIIRLIDTGEFSSMLVQYNLLHRHNDTAMARARQKGMGVSVMGPVGGGRIHFLSRLQPREGRKVPALALRYVWANPNVSVALSGMNELAMIEENAATASIAGPLSPVENEDIEVMLSQLQGLENLYCTGCGYCLPCPNGVDIPANLLMLNYLHFYGAANLSERYQKELVEANASADLCRVCNECVSKCPQDIPIPERLADVVIEFAAL
jgi:predicted aldo/keto reductase-like oxidoreductase